MAPGVVHIDFLIRTVSAESFQVTDSDLEHLKGLTNLECLHLGGDQVTDAGLEHLKGWMLKTLYLNGRSVIDEW